MNQLIPLATTKRSAGMRTTRFPGLPGALFGLFRLYSYLAKIGVTYADNNHYFLKIFEERRTPCNPGKRLTEQVC